MIGLKGPRALSSILPGMPPRARLHLAITSCLLIGFFPLMPGTIASLLTALLYAIGNAYLSIVVHILLWAVIVLLGVYSTRNLERGYQWEDPSFIVIDEVAGQYLALLLVPSTPVAWLLAFLGFRIFDVFKPLGIKRFESLKDGWGVMLDDMMAGFYAGLIIRIGYLWF